MASDEPRPRFIPGSLPLPWGELVGACAPRPPAAAGDLRCYSGRYAIWHAVGALQLAPGAGVAIPALQCGTEIDPLLARGLVPQFYAVGASFVAAPDAVARAIDTTTRAVLAIHYFGLAQEMVALRDFCRQRGLVLIEDCAHTLGGSVGGEPIGSIGDAAIFSPRKLLPMPEGGLLRLRETAGTSALPAMVRPPLRDTWRLLGPLVERGLRRSNTRAGSLTANLVARLTTGAGGPRLGLAEVGEQSWRHEFHSARVNWRMSAVAERILDRSDLPAIAQRRRGNFRFLLAHLRPTAHVRPVVNACEADAFPSGFPVAVTHPAAFLRRAAARGLHMRSFWQYCHPAFPASAFPEDTTLKEQLLLLPVHQYLTLEQLVTVCELALAWRGDA